METLKKLVVTPQGERLIELTQEEIAQRQLDEQQAEQDKLAREEKIAQEEQRKQSAISKLKAIGLTDEEITSLIGK